MSDYYAYIFVRQDLSPEQQLIQFGHVACVMGRMLPKHICPHNLNFVGIGVENIDGLFLAKMQMGDNGIYCHEFHESDLEENQLTAVASMPVRTPAHRNVFKSYNTLRFN